MSEAADSALPVGDAAAGFDELYQQSWWSMYGVALGLVGDRSTAEEVVQEAFATLYRRWPSLGAKAAALGYVRMCGVNGSPDALRAAGRDRAHLRAVPEETVEAADHTTWLSADHAHCRNLRIDDARC
jgi:DNA-directed RNA polymerase specialized sigma24 family protein